MNEAGQIAVFILLCIGFFFTIVAIIATLCGSKVTNFVSPRIWALLFGIIVLDITAGNIHWYITDVWSEDAQTALVITVTIAATLLVACCDLMLIGPATIGLAASWLVRSWFPADLSDADVALASFVVFLITIVTLVVFVMLLQYCFLDTSQNLIPEIFMTSWISARLLILVATNPSKPWEVYVDVGEDDGNQLNSLWTVLTWGGIVLIRLAVPLAICIFKRDPEESPLMHVEQPREVDYQTNFPPLSDPS